jgi:hypothetical protein
MEDKIVLLKVELSFEDFVKFAHGVGTAPDVYMAGYNGLTEDERTEFETKLGDVVKLCIEGRLREVIDSIGEE